MKLDHDELRKIASEIFGGEPSVYVEADPEIASLKWIIVEVVNRPGREDLRRKAWYRRTAKIQERAIEHKINLGLCVSSGDEG